jgi:hypothetical protein
MGKYRAKLNPFTGQLQLVNDIGVLFFKESVPAYVNLPITGNTKNDARIVDDTGHLYVWSLDVPDGALTDWYDCGDIIDLKWAAIEGKPVQPVADIDDAAIKRHDRLHTIISTSDHTSAATSGKMLKANANGLPIEATNTDTDVADAVSKKHSPNTDLYLTTPVTNILYVDSNRTDALPTPGGYTPNGSITKPFKKIQDAIDAIVAPSATNKHVIEIAPGAYYSDPITVNKVYTTFRSCGVQGARISGKITVTNPADPTPHQITFVGLRISGGLECLASHTAINCVDCNVTGSAWVINPTVPTDDEYLQVWSGLYNVPTTLTNVYAYLMGGGYYCTFVVTNKEFNINNADINDPFEVTLNGTVIASAYGNRTGNSKFNLNAGATLNIDADTEGGSVITKDPAAILNRTTKAANIKNIPAGTISATDVQAAINELDTEKTTLSAVKLDVDIADALTKRHERLDQFNKLVSGEIAGLTNKATPIDADNFLAENSENSDSKIKVLWSTIKATLKTYFDTLYEVAGAITAHLLAFDHTKIHTQNTDIALRTNKLTVDVSGNTEIVGELKIKVYSQDAEPTLGADQRLAMWIDTNDSNRVYFIFRRGVGDQVLVELS